MKKKYFEYISAAVLILFGIWGWFETSTWNIKSTTGKLSATTYPRILFTATLLLGAVILVRTLLKLFVLKKDTDELERVIDFHLSGVAGIVALLVFYIIIMEVVGFLIATPIFLFLSMLVFGERKWLRMAIISVVGSVVLYLFFVQLLGVQF